MWGRKQWESHICRYETFKDETEKYHSYDIKKNHQRNVNPNDSFVNHLLK